MSLTQALEIARERRAFLKVQRQQILIAKEQIKVELAGYKPKVIKEGASFPLINAWVATFPSAVTGRNYVIPLRVWADTSYGVIAAVTTSVKIDGTVPKPAG